MFDHLFIFLTAYLPRSISSIGLFRMRQREHPPIQHIQLRQH